MVVVEIVIVVAAVVVMVVVSVVVVVIVVTVVAVVGSSSSIQQTYLERNSNIPPYWNAVITYSILQLRNSILRKEMVKEADAVNRGLVKVSEHSITAFGPSPKSK